MKKLTPIIFASLFLLATTGHAEEKTIEDLQAQMAEIKSKLESLQSSNTDLKKQLSSYENEIEGWRAALKSIEDEIELLSQQ